MKKLKKFKKFESSYFEIDNLLHRYNLKHTNEEIDYINDILIDIKDDHLDLNIHISNFIIGSYLPKIALKILISDDRLLPVEITNYLLSIDSYLRSMGWVGINTLDYKNINLDDHKSYVMCMTKYIADIFKQELNEFNSKMNYKIRLPFNHICICYYKNK